MKNAADKHNGVWNIRHNKEARKHMEVAKKKMQTAGVPDYEITNASAVRFALKHLAESRKEAP